MLPISGTLQGQCVPRYRQEHGVSGKSLSLSPAPKLELTVSVGPVQGAKAVSGWFDSLPCPTVQSCEHQYWCEQREQDVCMGVAWEDRILPAWAWNSYISKLQNQSQEVILLQANDCIRFLLQAVSKLCFV